MQEQKNAIIEDNARSAKILYDLEDNLLAALSGSTVAELLENDDLIILLADSQKTSAEIKKKQEEARITEIEIDKKRLMFRPIAFRSQLLFFAIVDLNLIDSMY